MNIAIIGAGSMGKWFAKFCKDRGWKVTITDKNYDKASKVAEDLSVETSKNNKGAAKDSDIIIISVPIKNTPLVIREMEGILNDDSLLLDIASVKEAAVDTMKEIDVESELASIHPLFGPGAKNLEGLNIASVPVRPGEKYESFKKVFSDLGAQVIELDAEEHDKIMSVTQSLTHFILLTFLSALDSMSEQEKAKNLSTPMFQRLLNLSKAFLSEDPKVCGDIQTENRYAHMARSTTREACRSLDTALKVENIGVIEDIFEKAIKNIEPEEIESTYKELYKDKGG